MERKNCYQHRAELEIAELKRRQGLDVLGKSPNEILRTIYAVVTPDTCNPTVNVREARPTEIALVLRQGQLATISRQKLHRKEGGRKRKHK